ncbi:hypothetical protein [Thalassotalea sp. ND16A]|uniref:hypothetical protein n=1 Tax=Thalassotalea sp. ND16A TaxID=1535422 RepID=UPI00051A6F34|nr:hypothetical protein [Thalassotalea sp. ND16A]KGJ99623.1 hypothetical protein ND16A_3723 [Thalassotalea sp. ND16A]
MKTGTVIYLKEHSRNLSLDELMTVMQKDKAKCVIIDIEQYRQENLALHELMQLAEKSLSNQN